MIEAILNNQAEIIEAVMGVVVVASLIVAGTKTPDPDTVLGKIYKVVEWASLTFGKAKQSGAVVPEKIKVEMVKGTVEKVDETKK
jgi:hypothetical protein|tara:strand:- start:471 stop:725 length:255 start_codon:yes stop_codon:yes gene_type:complete